MIEETKINFSITNCAGTDKAILFASNCTDTTHIILEIKQKEFSGTSNPSSKKWFVEVSSNSYLENGINYQETGTENILSGIGCFIQDQNNPARFDVSSYLGELNNEIEVANCIYLNLATTGHYVRIFLK